MAVAVVEVAWMDKTRRNRSPGITYLASPYSHPSAVVREQRFQAACRAAAALMQQGRVVYSPIAHTHPIAVLCDLPKGWEYWRQYDEAFLAASSEVVVLMLDGWQESASVRAEIEIAERDGKPVRYMTPEELGIGVSRPASIPSGEKTGTCESWYLDAQCRRGKQADAPV